MSKNINTNEIDLTNFIYNSWKYRYYIISFVALTSIICILYVFLVKPEYELYAVIDPSPVDESTSLESISMLGGLMNSAANSNAVLKSLIISIKSDSFLKELYDKYKDNNTIFDFKEIKSDLLGKTEQESEQIRLEYGLNRLHHIIKYSLDVDNDVIKISVRLTDKMLAYEMLNNLLQSLKVYIGEQNRLNLENDIVYFSKLINHTSDFALKNRLSTLLAKKKQRQQILSNNLFSIVRQPVIPSKKKFPSKKAFVGLTVIVSFLLSFMVVSLVPSFKILKYKILDQDK